MPKTSIPQGTRDFGAETVRKRNYIFNTIREVFELYGFQPLETPAMENLETLMGKYGEEGDKLIFRILDSGQSFSIDFFYSLFDGIKNYFENNRNELAEIKTDLIEGQPGVFAMLAKNLLTNETLGNTYLSKLKNESSEKALRYDLTIPFARYVAMNHGQLMFPYKRYQMQPVWRADRPQKGRYREFYQCDADLVGSNSLLSDVEFANIYADVFKRLKIDVEIKINNRKILTALAETCGSIDKLTDITVAIDKLDKIGIEKVKEELLQRGLNEEQIAVVEKYLSIEGTNVERLNELKKLIGENETGKTGIEELEFVMDSFTIHHSPFTIDFTLARGLNYYTGIIFEVKAKNVSIGSIGGGGRYDDLTGLFGVPNIPGVGISFGVDRIYDVMEELKLFPETIYVGTKVLFFNLGDEESKVAFGLMQQLRSNYISCELYHEQAKFDKQFKYADKKNIPFAVIIGNKELEEKTCNIKNLKTGKQETIEQSKLPNYSFS
ncbi:MAG TPA: histidine--tRNA ligase [Puia sp.]|nr:histidine--tRNA ligase [Puia sp.]